MRVLRDEGGSLMGGVLRPGFRCAVLVLYTAAGCVASVEAPEAADLPQVAVLEQALSASDCPAGYNRIQGTNGADI
jgi:hypothetical protein